MNLGVACRIAICALLSGPAVRMSAQTVRSAGAGVMEFKDEVNGVSFRYPASWTFSEGSNFYSPPAILTPSTPLHGAVYTQKIAGVQPWPDTIFIGVEFSYATVRVKSADDCRDLADPDHRDGGYPDRQALNGLTFNHATTASAGLGHGINEEIYTIGRGSDCWLFDLEIHSSGVTADKAPRGFSSREKQAIDRQLHAILASVKIRGLNTKDSD